METLKRTKITVQTTINAPVEKVWNYWNEPQHITQWCAASDDWHAPFAENDLRDNGVFKTTMAAKDGSFSFDFAGQYTKVEPYKAIEYIMGDGRTVQIIFAVHGNTTRVTETFDAETENPIEMQRGGWQSILENFKAYVEK